MLTYWVLLPATLLLLLTAADTRANPTEPRSFSAEPSLQGQPQPPVPEDEVTPDGDGVRRFACPTGFFRLRRNCYYLSAGTAAWKEAHFQCTARNATLAVLNRNGKDKMLRKYLMGNQFRRLERWIGGMYNWRQKDWEWGVSGEKLLFRNFANGSSDSSSDYYYHCLVLDPQQQYKWSARSCVEQKYYICEAPAGRIAKSRRRKNITGDPMAPQNQRLRSPTRREDQRRQHHHHHHRSEALQQQQQQQQRNGKLKSMRKKNWQTRGDDNQIWAHGIKLGARPPKGSSRRGSLKRGDGKNSHRHSGHKHGLHKQALPETGVSQVSARPGEYDAFPADGRVLTVEQLQSLDDQHHHHVYSPIFGKDYVREEVLLKV